MRRLFLLSSLFTLVITSCGDPLADGNYRGEPIQTIQGFIARFEQVPAAALRAPKRVALFWSPSGQTDVEVGELVEQSTVSVEVEALSDFRLEIFHPPAPRLFVSEAPAYAVALLLVYADVDGDGRYAASSGDLLLGGALDRAVIYAPVALSSETSFTRLDIPAGFYTVQIPVDCAELPEDILVCDESSVPSDFGQLCDESSTFCEPPGFCLSPDDDNELGVCVLLEAQLDCKPQGARLVDGLWSVGCLRDQGCHDYAGTSCDLTQGVCFPSDAPCPDSIVPGRACDSDEDCGSAGGICLTEDPFALVSYRNGYCVYDDALLGCQPNKGSKVLDCEVFSEEGGCLEESQRWYQACLSDGECRVDEGYRCDSVGNICDMAGPLELSIVNAFSPARDMFPFCTSWEEDDLDR